MGWCSGARLTDHRTELLQRANARNASLPPCRPDSPKGEPCACPATEYPLYTRCERVKKEQHADCHCPQRQKGHLAVPGDETCRCRCRCACKENYCQRGNLWS